MGAFAMARKTRSEQLSAQREKVEKAKNRLLEIRKKSSERIGKLAQKSGLADLEISDAELSDAFKELVSRFRQSRKIAPDS